MHSLCCCKCYGDCVHCDAQDSKAGGPVIVPTDCLPVLPSTHQAEPSAAGPAKTESRALRLTAGVRLFKSCVFREPRCVTC